MIGIGIPMIHSSRARPMVTSSKTLRHLNSALLIRFQAGICGWRCAVNEQSLRASLLDRVIGFLGNGWCDKRERFPSVGIDRAMKR